MKKPTLVAILVSIFSVLLAHAGYLYGLLYPMQGMYFLGRRLINSLDTYTYISFIEQARQGRWVFNNQFTTEVQTPILIRPLYAVFGRVGDFLAISSRDMYIFGGIVVSLIFCLVLYKFLSRIFSNDWTKVFVFSLILTSNGFGYFLYSLFPNSIDLWIPEANTFLSLGEAPHFIFSQILMLFGFTYYLQGIQEKRPRGFIISAFAFLILIFEHPFNIFVTFTVMGVLTIIFERRKMIPQKMVSWIVLVFLVQLGGILFHFQGVITNLILRQWYQANVLPSPSPINFIIGYGLLIPFMLIGMEKFLKKQDQYRLLIIVWVAVTFVLLYSPLSFQRRVSEGLHIPIGVLAGVGVLVVCGFVSRFFVESVRSKMTALFGVSMLMILSIGSFASSINDIQAIRSDSQSSYFYHISNAEKQALDILRENTSFGDTILANVSYGNLLPGITGRKTFIGHAVQTHNLEQKIAVANSFLLQENHDAAYAFLRDHGITFIFLGPGDSMLEYGFRPDLKPYLELSYNNNGILIYHVLTPEQINQNQALPQGEDVVPEETPTEPGTGEGVGEGLNAQDVNIFIPAEDTQPTVTEQETQGVGETSSSAPTETSSVQ